MKKTLALLIALLLAVASVGGLAEDVTNEKEYFVIGATTPVNGMFFTDMWGRNTSDIDVRSLLHGYSPVAWTMQSLFEVNYTVCEEVTVGLLDDGNKMYIIKLNEDLRYNDGSPITAEDYVFSLLLHASPLIEELGGIVTKSAHIAGYEDYYAGKTNVFAGVRMTDEYTFTVEINQEYLPFFFELSMIDSRPYPMSVIAPGCEVVDDGFGCYIRNIDQTIEEPLFTAELLAETILDEETGYLRNPRVTAGPYQLETYDRETAVVTFTINEYFKGLYDGQRPTIDNLLLKPVIPETMVQEMVDDEVQLLNKVVSGENIDEGLQLLTQGIVAMRSYLRMGMGFLTFACEEGPGSYESVRRAIAYAVDTDQFVADYTTANYGRPVYGYYGIGQWMYQMIDAGSQRPLNEQGEEDPAWEGVKLSLSELNHYDKNLDTAKKLLVDDGWTLNESGDTFVEGRDTVRYKMVDGELMGLTLNFGKMIDSQAVDILLEQIEGPLAELGIVLDIEDVEFRELLKHYYREEPRTYDMMYLATNFYAIFDPYYVFNTEDKYQGPVNTTGFRDEQLEALALDLRQTEPGDLLTYCIKWVAFQEYFNEKLPMIPLYSNVYFDFFTPELQNYMPDSEMNWPVAIVYATLGDAEGVALGDVTSVLDGSGEPAEGEISIED